MRQKCRNETSLYDITMHNGEWYVRARQTAGDMPNNFSAIYKCNRSWDAIDSEYDVI